MSGQLFEAQDYARGDLQDLLGVNPEDGIDLRRKVMSG